MQSQYEHRLIQCAKCPYHDICPCEVLCDKLRLRFCPYIDEVTASLNNPITPAGMIAPIHNYLLN